MSGGSNLTTLLAAAENKPDSTPALDVVKLIIPDVSWTGTVGSDSHIKFKHHHPESNNSCYTQSIWLVL